MGKYVNVFKTSQVEPGAHRQKAETGLSEGRPALPLQHQIKLGLQGMQVEHIVSRILLLLIGQFLGRPVRALLMLGELNPQELAS